MFKVLRAGDPHVKVSNLAEAIRLMQFIYQKAVEHSVDRVEFLGDLFHTHAILRVEVLDFWDKFLSFLSEKFEVVVIVGNHDQIGDYSSPQHALSTLKRINPGKLHIIDTPTQMGVFGYMPYIHDKNVFTESANKLAESGAKVLVCHATFQGSKYETGMYAPDGFDADLLNFPLIISGHIHSKQRFGKVIYPGTAKWDTNSDANEEKGIWLFVHGENGEILKEEMIDTSSVCTPIYKFQWKEGEAMPEIPAGRVSIELVGSSEWVKRERAKLTGKVSVSSKITDKVNKVNRKAGKSLEDFLANNFDVTTGIDRKELIEFMKELKVV